MGIPSASRFCMAIVAPLTGVGALWSIWACVRRRDIERDGDRELDDGGEEVEETTGACDG